MNGKLVINENGYKEWHSRPGVLHREDGPAIEYPDGSKRWFINGKSHREDGPAIDDTGLSEYSYFNQEWWLNDVQYTKGEHWELTHPPKYEPFYHNRLDTVE